MNEERTRLESRIRETTDAEDYQAAATAIIEGYEDEVMGFLVARMRSGSDAAEAFSMFAEDMWTGLPAFGWRSTMRSWVYTLARNAANRYARKPANQGRRHATFTGNASLSQLVEHTRTATQMHVKSEVKGGIRALREQLPEDDQTLLILRVDRGHSWKELAHVMAEEPFEEEALKREIARLRKQFERVKGQLKTLAQSAGLLD